MKTAWVKAPFQFSIRDMDLGSPGDDELILDIRACGVSGGDLEAAREGARDWRAFGHEAAGVVTAVGARVRDLEPGRKVIWGRGSESRPAAAFAEYVIVPREAVLPFEGISFTAAALVRPLAVALDLVDAAGIELGDDVLVAGTGAVGLMALRLARTRGARRLYAAQRSGARRRLDLARELGADELILSDETKLEGRLFAKGYVDRALVTAGPQVLPGVLAVLGPGGVAAFVGAGSAEGERITLDADQLRARGLTLRGRSGTSAADLGRCVDLIASGMVDAERLVSHTFELEEIPQAFRILRDDRQNRVKLVMVKD